MSYEKTIWADGDIISAQRMNNIENGIENLSTNSEQTNFPVVVFNLDDIIDEAQNENGFRLSTFTDAIEQGKTICILKRITGSTLQDFIYFLASSGSYDSIYFIVFENSKIFLDRSDKNLTYARLFFTFNEELLTGINISQYSYNLSTATGEETSDTIWPVSTDPVESGDLV